MATTSNMSLDLPDVSVTIGPTYATKNNTAFTVIDAHDHTPGKGPLIPTAGLNINADLEFNSNSALELKKVGLDAQGTLLTGTRFLQADSSGELYWNDGSANQVKITNSGSINVAGSGGFGGDYVSAGASAVYTDSIKAYTFRDSASAQALMIFKGMENSGKAEWNTTAITSNTTLTDSDDNLVILVDSASGAITLTLPDPTLGTRVFVIKDSGNNADVNNITVARNGSENINASASDLTMSLSGSSILIISDGTDWWTFGDYEVNSSITAFEGGTGATSIPTSFASPTLSAAAFTKGTAVSRSTNTLTFPFEGTWEVRVDLAQVDVAASNSDVIVRLRNTTGGSTTGKTVTLGGEANPQSCYSTFFVNITDKTDDFEIQWAATSATTVNGNTVDSETSVGWRVTFIYRG